ncbi:LysR family transcriptional regulator [Alphaproteobacteria bacterium]|nr:LysR family transcriptional regulator [Alphaproteobacteria bacterium]
MINNNIKLQQLRHFVLSAKVGNFSKASKDLGIAQPALSQSIVKLETNLNVKLLKRTQKGVTLTEAGKLFFPKVTSILNNLNEAEQDIKSLTNNPSGDVKIFLSPKLAGLISVKLYKLILLKYPKINIQFEEGFGLRGGKLIENGEVDLGILPDWNFNINVNSKLIVSDNLYFYGKKDKIHNTNDSIKFSELINYPLILTGAQIVLRQKLNSLSNQLGKKLQIILESESQTYTQSFINEGLAYSIGPSEASYVERKDNKFFAKEIVEPNISRSVTLCWPKNKAVSNATEIVAQNIVFIMKELLEEKILIGNYKVDEKKEILI